MTEKAPAVQGGNVMLLHGNDVLLLRRLSGTWEFPGGTCEPARDTDAAGCAVRELAEETGIDLRTAEAIEPVWSHIMPGDTHKGIERPPMEDHYFVGYAALRHEVVTSEDHDHAEWTALPEAARRLNAAAAEALTYLPEA